MSPQIAATPSRSAQPVLAPAAVPLAKVAASKALLREAVARFGRVVYASSLGAESLVLMDLIYGEGIAVDLFTVDTGRLFEQTRELLERLERRYQRRLRVIHPDAANLQNFVSQHGINAFYGSLELRQQCCHIRKVEPFARAIYGYNAWVTGVRHDQSAARAANQPIETDERYGIHKISPLLAWTNGEVWAYVRERQLPYNPLHDVGYPSIGCAPCTRAVEPDEDERSGRWWWESPESRECGLQPRKLPETLSDL